MKTVNICELSISELGIVGGGKKGSTEQESYEGPGVAKIMLAFAGLAVVMLGTVIVVNYIYNRFDL